MGVERRDMDEDSRTAMYYSDSEFEEGCEVSWTAEWWEVMGDRSGGVARRLRSWTGEEGGRTKGRDQREGSPPPAPNTK